MEVNAIPLTKVRLGVSERESLEEGGRRGAERESGGEREEAEGVEARRGERRAAAMTERRGWRFSVWDCVPATSYPFVHAGGGHVGLHFSFLSFSLLNM